LRPDAGNLNSAAFDAATRTENHQETSMKKRTFLTAAALSAAAFAAAPPWPRTTPSR
jgi:hypothetical protein